MTPSTRALRGVLLLSLVTLLAACATAPDNASTSAESARPSPPPPASVAPTPPPPPPPPPPPTATSELAAGIRSYDDGDYKRAEQHFQAALDMGLGNAADRAKTHKYRAFMVCVTGREKQCREEFRLALVDDPDLVLAPAEATHPVWPKVLTSVKQEMARAAARKAPAKAAPAKPADASKAPPATKTPTAQPAATSAPAKTTPTQPAPASAK